MALNIRENTPLAPYTTFKIGGSARFYCSVQTEDELLEACRFADERSEPVFVLGGGSNVLISDKGFQGLVVRIRLKGIEVSGVHVSAAAGELWDDLVAHTVDRGLFGLENLSAIPGTVGAAPVQNIGAYGTEVSNTIVSVRALDRTTQRFVEFSNAECRFGYRDSRFKHEKGRYVITQVNFRLSPESGVDLSYKEVQDYFTRKGQARPSLVEVRAAIIDIRWNKLPDWKLWGTAGSFFKNPIIAADTFAELKNKYPELPGFPEPNGRVKVSLGWILDKICNMRGLRSGNVSVYEKQALVIVTKLGATAEEVVHLAQRIMREVKEKTGIEIEGEVEWVN